MSKRPNIIYILADDMGYGDIECNNPGSKIPTPSLDQLAAQGMRFTDTHAASSVCTPSRYNILTGRYCWRSRLKHGIVWEWDGSLIEPGRRTVAHMLRDNGYQTACIGKWHLGWNWRLKDGRNPNDEIMYGFMNHKKRCQLGREIDFDGPIEGGPVDRGFDSYFGVDVPNFPPYTWFQNDRLVDPPIGEKPPDMYGHAGPAKPGWVLEEMIPEFTRRAVDFIEKSAGDEQPYFLYFPLTSPHSPIVPNVEFKGKSGCGPYGDFVCEVDWVVGRIMDAVDRSGRSDSTLVIFTSDNGPERETSDEIGVYNRIREYGHYSMSNLRGIKRDTWEGGHRVPFIARWPSNIPAGTTCSQLVTLGDLMATCADILEVDLHCDEGEDSVSMLPLLLGNIDTPVRETAVHHSAGGRFAMRKGDWVLIEGPTGDENNEPEWFKKERNYSTHSFPLELFNLRDDIEERCNCYDRYPDRVKVMLEELTRLKMQGGCGEKRTGGFTE